MHEVNAFIPTQYIARWRPETAVLLRILFYIDLDQGKLNKVFIPKDSFDTLQINDYVKAGRNLDVVKLCFDDDDEGRERLIEIKTTGKVLNQIDNEE